MKTDMIHKNLHKKKHTTAFYPCGFPTDIYGSYERIPLNGCDLFLDRFVVSKREGKKLMGFYGIKTENNLCEVYVYNDEGGRVPVMMR